MAECRSCQAPLIWGTSVSTGKSMPIDAEPTELGNIQFVAEFGMATVLTGDALASARAAGEPLHLNHFVTCPDAHAYRHDTKGVTK